VANLSSNVLIVSALAGSVKLASRSGCSFCDYRLLKGFTSYRNLFDFLLRLVVLKRPGFSITKIDTLPREPNPCYTVVFHMCSCETITVSRK